MKKAIIKKGDKYNRLIAIKFSYRDKWYQQHWTFKCECGKEKVLNVYSVKKGLTKSCGCLQGEAHITHGMRKTRIYDTWRGMKRRCLNKNYKKFKDYGGRGITVCDEWLEFINFYNDMGDIPDKKTLDRIDNNGNYCKENCRWTTWIEQANNRRNNRFLTYKGKTQTISQWARELNTNHNVISRRLKRGWSIRKTLITFPPSFF